MDHLKYPVIFGAYDHGDKACVVTKSEALGGYSLYVCRLKNCDLPFGAAVEKKDIQNVICRFCFVKLESAKAFLRCVERLVEEMKKEQ